MGNFNKGGRGGSSFGNKRGSFGGHDRGRTEMHRAVCSGCGNECEVPFRPTGDKPVYCNECFKNEGRSGERDFGRKDFGGRDRGRDRGGRRDDRGERQMHQATCAECGKKCEVPFRPSGDKPVLCSECFGGGSSRNAGPSRPTQSNEKQDEIIAKLDKILTLLQRTNSVKEVTVMKENKEENKKKEEKEEEVIKKFTKKASAEKKVPAKKTAPKKAVKKPVAKKKASAKKK